MTMAKIEESNSRLMPYMIYFLIVIMDIRKRCQINIQDHVIEKKEGFTEGYRQQTEDKTKD
jgi:hypothetical protein